MSRTITLVAASAIILFVGWVVLSVIRAQRADAARDAVRQDLGRLMTAMHQYHDDYDSFPPAFVKGPDGERWHSWRALLLPYVAPDTAVDYRYAEQWNSPHNSQLAESAPPIFQSEAASPGPATASYFAVVGRNTLWPAWQSLRIASVTDGASSTIAIVEDGRSDICWLEPKDPRIDEFMQSYYTDMTLHNGMGRTVAFADGSVRFLSGTIDRVTLASLLTPSTGSDTFRNDIWPDDLRPVLPKQLLYAPRTSDSMTCTDIHASAKQPLKPEWNQIWCASFQIAWDQLSQGFDCDNETIALLNQSPFDPASLSSEATFSAVTDTSQEQDQRMLAEIHKRFSDVAPSIHQVRKDADRRLRFYSMIRKQMPFEIRFDRFTGALRFSQAAAPVNSFGIDPATERENLKAFTAQVTILDDRGDDNCVVRLSTAGPQQDQIILAMLPPEQTLLDTWTTVEDLIREPNPAHNRRSLETNETLCIPIIDFSLKHHFTELEGLKTSPSVFPRYWIDLAFMEIRLRLDDTGADFMSAGEFAVVGEFGEPEFDPKRIRNFTFSRPFLVALMEPLATQPYFLAWIANEELLESFGE